MLQRLRESLALLLIGLLPLHALLVTVGTKMLEGPNHAPITILALWKEALLAIILVIAFLEWLKRPKRDMSRWAFDDTDILIVGLIIFSIIVTAITHSDWKLYLFGFKYDFVPLVAFFVLRRVEWSDSFARCALRVLVGVGVAVAAYGIATMFLSQRFFMWLGYSDLHSLYLPDAPLAAFQQIGDSGIRRIQSTMSGPNQLGLWLLVPWSISIVALLRGKKLSSFWFLVSGLLGMALVLTFSRSAWIAAAIIVVFAYRTLKSPEEYRRFIIQLTTFILEVLTLIILFVPSILVRATSSLDHITRPMEAIEIMRENPLGLGLGTAGPASNRVSDACVYLENGSDYSWASDRPQLCVFVGSQQVQPLDHRCRCPLLPENWYLQIGVEMGLIGFVMFITVIMFVLRALRIRDDQKELFLIFLGISIAALFLHAWEDSAVAYTVWILAAYLPVSIFGRSPSSNLGMGSGSKSKSASSSGSTAFAASTGSFVV
ncbi:hypothetical protein KKF55_03375 [Patescibacteria group bacterium]|nr:hypothetical protein [Patescibacteria group bacterium]